jgi:putative endonuclease
MYYVYILQCADETLYTGICTELDRRLDEHNSSAKWA